MCRCKVSSAKESYKNRPLLQEIFDQLGGLIIVAAASQCHATPRSIVILRCIAVQNSKVVRSLLEKRPYFCKAFLKKSPDNLGSLIAANANYFYRRRLLRDMTHSYVWHDAFMCAM